MIFTRACDAVLLNRLYGSNEFPVLATLYYFGVTCSILAAIDVIVIIYFAYVEEADVTVLLVSFVALLMIAAVFEYFVPRFKVTQECHELAIFSRYYVPHLRLEYNADTLDMFYRACNSAKYVVSKLGADNINNVVKSRQHEYRIDLAYLRDCADDRVCIAALTKLQSSYDPEIYCHISYTSPKGKSNRQCTVRIDKCLYNYESSGDVNKFGMNKDKVKEERSKLTPKIRYQVLKKYNYTCQYCGRTASDGVKLHVDHIIPVSRGGKTEMDNLTVACEECNIGKGSDI